MNTDEILIKQFSLPSDGKIGIAIRPLNPADSDLNHVGKPHRDDHYKFLFATQGTIRLRIDFREVAVVTPGIICVYPGQVHHMLERNNAKGWMMGVEIPFLEKEIITNIGSYWETPFDLSGQNDLVRNIDNLITTAYSIQSDCTDIFRSKSILHLLNALMYLILGGLKRRDQENKVSRESRGFIIHQTFRQLLSKHFLEWRSPSDYAGKLSISVSHLNDTIKGITGSSVSDQIQEELMLEAKRLLYYTDMESRQIAFKLGYNDPIHFGKIFKKRVGLSPLAFRDKFRD